MDSIDPTNMPGSHVNAVSYKAVTQLITNTTTYYDPAPTGPRHQTNKRYTDPKNAEIEASVRLYANQKAEAAKRYAKEQDVIVTSACVLKSGSAMTGDLTMGGKRVSGLFTGASTSESDVASMAQVVKVVIDNMTKSDREPLHMTNKPYAAGRQYVNGLEILNYSGHIPPRSKTITKRVLKPQPAHLSPLTDPHLAFNSDVRGEWRGTPTAKPALIDALSGTWVRMSGAFANMEGKPSWGAIPTAPRITS